MINIAPAQKGNSCTVKYKVRGKHSAVLEVIKWVMKGTGGKHGRGHLAAGGDSRGSVHGMVSFEFSLQ